MKHISHIVVLIMLMCVLSSCGNMENEPQEMDCSPDESILELVSKRYSNSQLDEIAQSELTLDEMNEKYPIECVRKIETAYRVAYLGNEKVAVIMFDGNGSKTVGKVYGLNLKKADFDKLAIGQKLTDVQTIDPKGEYLFLQTGRNDAPKVSNHYTTDGYLVEVEYDEENTVVSVTSALY